MDTEDTWLWLFEWFEMTGPGVLVRESIWLFPVLEAVHLLGLCLLGGAVLVVDLRMLGLTMRDQSAAHLYGQMKPWLKLALIVLLSTGVCALPLTAEYWHIGATITRFERVRSRSEIGLNN